MDSPQENSPKKGIRFRAVEATNEQDTVRARKLARAILDDPEVETLTVGMRGALQRVLTPIFGDRPSDPVERVIVSLPQRDRIQPEKELPPPTRSLIRGSPVMGGHFRFPVNSFASSGMRGK